MLCRRVRHTTNRSERRTSRSAWPASRDIYSTASWWFLEEWFSNGVLTVSRGASCKRELRLHQPLQNGPRFVSDQRVLHRSSDHFVIPVAAVFRAASASRPNSKQRECCGRQSKVVAPVTAIKSCLLRSNCETARKYDVLGIPIRSRKKWRTSCPSPAARNTAPMGTETIHESTFPTKRDIDDCLG